MICPKCDSEIRYIRVFVPIETSVGFTLDEKGSLDIAWDPNPNWDDDLDCNSDVSYDCPVCGHRLADTQEKATELLKKGAVKVPTTPAETRTF